VELEALQDEIVRLGGTVSAALERAVRSLKERDRTLAQAVIDADVEVNRAALEIEQRSLTLLATQQPMASDLRALGATLKLVTDLERIGDHAKGIARVALRLGDEPLIKPLIDVPRMAEVVREMVDRGLQAFMSRDQDAALAMAALDDEVDRLYRAVFDELLQIMIDRPGTITQATHLLMVATHLERAADHATNLAEWLLYVLTGERRELND